MLWLETTKDLSFGTRGTQSRVKVMNSLKRLNPKVQYIYIEQTDYYGTVRSK